MQQSKHATTILDAIIYANHKQSITGSTLVLDVGTSLFIKPKTWLIDDSQARIIAIFSFKHKWRIIVHNINNKQ